MKEDESLSDFLKRTRIYCKKCKYLTLFGLCVKCDYIPKIRDLK